jgi:hypothetical protein
MNFLEEVRSLADYTRQLDWYLRKENPDRRTEHNADSAGQKLHQGHRLAAGVQLFYGRVVDIMPVAGWYKINPEISLPTLPCCLATDTARGPVGARAIHTLPPGTQVIFAWRVDEPAYGRIIATLPDLNADPSAVFGDMISMQSAGVDPTLALLLSLPGFSGLMDWSSGGARDTHGHGEAGYISETGVRMLVDSYMAILAANEHTGLWAFRDDDLVRLAGENLQIRSGCGEEEHWNDEGEIVKITTSSPYFWERLGAWNISMPTATVGTPDPATGIQAIEPVFPDQQPFNRRQDYEGYLGQGGRRSVCLQPMIQPGTLNRFQDLNVYPGVFQEQIGLHGGYTLASALRVLLTKQINLPTPKQIRRPEDTNGDNRSNYKAARTQGSGPVYPINANLTDPNSDGYGSNAILGSYDRHAYLMGRDGPAAFRAHTLDWFTPETSDSGLISGVHQLPIAYGLLTTSYALPVPSPVTAFVDYTPGGYGNVSYTPNSSVFELLDDGGILARDGWNSAIAMKEGNLELAPPGDVVLRPGRNVVVMAGCDVIIRSRRNVDISTTNGETRIRSGSTFMLKAADIQIFSGLNILLDGRLGAVTVWSQDFYVQAGTSIKGGIHLDAGDIGIVTMHAKTIERFVDQGCYDYFLNSGSVIAGNSYEKNGVTFYGSLAVGGCVSIIATLYVGGGIYSDDIIAGTATANPGGLVLMMTDTTAATVLTAATVSIVSIGTSGNTAWMTDYTNCLYATNGPGNTTLQGNTYFTYRDVASYGTTNFAMYESIWQQQARLSGMTSGLTMWTEDAEHGTYPYPGAGLIDMTGYRTMDLTIFDATTGQDTATTGSNYVNPTYATFNDQPMNGNYLVIDLP